MSTNFRKYLDAAQDAERQGDPLNTIATAVIGILATVVDAAERDDREDMLIDQHDAADAALARVLALADDLDKHPHATLKPTAFRDLAAKIREAVDA